MWFTYILNSRKYDKYYIGYTEDLEKRIAWHNKGKSRWTRKYRPWKVAYVEAYRNKTDAIKREKKIKSYKNKMYLKGMIGEVC